MASLHLPPGGWCLNLGAVDPQHQPRVQYSTGTYRPFKSIYGISTRSWFVGVITYGPQRKETPHHDHR